VTQLDASDAAFPQRNAALTTAFIDVTADSSDRATALRAASKALSPAACNAGLPLVNDNVLLSVELEAWLEAAPSLRRFDFSLTPNRLGAFAISSVAGAAARGVGLPIRLAAGSCRVELQDCHTGESRCND